MWESSNERDNKRESSIQCVYNLSSPLLLFIISFRSFPSHYKPSKLYVCLHSPDKEIVFPLTCFSSMKTVEKKMPRQMKRRRPREKQSLMLTIFIRFHYGISSVWHLRNKKLHVENDNKRKYDDENVGYWIKRYLRFLS